MTKLKSITKYIIAGALIAFMVLSMAVTAAFAYEAVDFDKDANLTVAFKGDDTYKVAGITFSAYRIAEFDENSNLKMLSKFASYSVGALPDTQDGYRSLASTLQAYIVRDAVKADYTATTDESGVAAFGAVEKGIYLILSKAGRYGDNVYSFTPIMVTAPNLDEKEEWNYDVVVAPKYGAAPVPPKEEKISLNVLKLWEDDEEMEANRPASIDVELIADGQVIKTVTLNKANNWRASFTDLDASKEYFITESVVVSGYEVKIEREGNTFTITNSGTVTPPGDDVKDVEEKPDVEPPTPETPSKPPTTPPTTPTPPTPDTPSKLPQTGQLWWPVPIMMGAGIVLFAAGIIRKRRNA